MIPLTELWLPIVVSAAFVFIASSIIHMLLPIHAGDFKRLPNEDKLLDALRSVPPGEYCFPRPSSMKEMSSPEMVARYKQGPVGNVTLMPAGVPNIGKSLLQWFLYSLIVSIFAGYIASVTLRPGESYLKVFQVAGTAALAIYALSNVMNSIWKGVSWGTTVKYVIDGVVYGLVTAGAFGWLWPKSL